MRGIEAVPAREVALGFTGEALAVCFSENEEMSYEQVLQVLRVWGECGPRLALRVPSLMCTPICNLPKALLTGLPLGNRCRRLQIGAFGVPQLRLSIVV